MISDEGWPYFLKLKSGTLPVGQATDDHDTSIKHPWGELDIEGWEPGVVRIYGMDIHYNGIQEELTAVSYSERNKFSGRSSLRFPQNYFIYDQTKVGLLPAPDAGLSKKYRSL